MIQNYRVENKSCYLKIRDFLKRRQNSENFRFVHKNV